MRTRLRNFITAMCLAGAPACGLPPVVTTEQHIFVPYTMIAPAPDGVTLLSDAFQSRQVPVTTVTVPKEAGAFKVTQAWLVCRVENGGALPLDMDLYVSAGSQDPYQTKALTEGWHLAPESQTGKKEFPLDPTWLQAQRLQLGARFGSPGGVTLGDSDRHKGINITHQLRVVVQIL